MEKFNKDICDEIVDWFLKTSYAKDMDNCLNGVDEHHLNPYHQERSVLDHSLMVANKAIEYWRDDKDFYILFMAGLIHDIGKIRARSVEMRNSSGEMMCIFRNHENIGLTFASDVLTSFLNTDIARKINYTWFDLIRTLILTPYHDIYKYTHKEAETMYRDYTRSIAMFSVCDTRGRLMDEPRDIDEHIKYISSGDTNLGNKINKKLFNIDFLIGVPSSGKSTYSEIHKRNYNYKYIISRDDIIDNLNWYLSLQNMEFSEYNKYNLSQNIISSLLDVSFNFNTYKERFDELTKRDLQKWIDHIFMYRYHMAIMNNDGNILIDKTNLVKKSRRQLLNVFTKSPYGKVIEIKKQLSLFNKRAIIMVESYSNIIKRNELRGNKVDKNIIDNMIMTSNIPNFEEFDDLIFTKIVKLERIVNKDSDDPYLMTSIKNILNESSTRYIDINDEFSEFDCFIDLNYLIEKTRKNNLNIKFQNNNIVIYTNDNTFVTIKVIF